MTTNITSFVVARNRSTTFVVTNAPNKVGLEISLNETEMDAIYQAMKLRYAVEDLEDYIENLRGDDREEFQQLLAKLGLTEDEWDAVSYSDDAEAKLRKLAEIFLEARQKAEPDWRDAADATIKDYLEGKGAAANGEI